MKRQSKPEKIKKEKSTASGEWLYFAPANVTVRSIYEVLTDDYEVEIWEDAGVHLISNGQRFRQKMKSRQHLQSNMAVKMYF